jgi:hypothetical protein
MTKAEFISFLKIKAEEAGLFVSHWKQTYVNSEEYWKLYRPCVDWMEDKMDLTIDGVVTITFNESFYDDPKSIDMTYEEFAENYSKSVGSF